MTGEPKSRVVLLLAIVMAIAGPTWAIRPEGPLTSLHSLHDRGIVVSPPGAGGYVGIYDPLPGKAGDRIAALDRNKALQEFVARTGQDWLVRWNPITGTPHLVTGRPLALAGVQKLTSENIKAACLDFVAAEADLLKVRPGQLRLTNKVKAGGRWYVGFGQVHNGVPVLGGQLRMSFTRDDRLIMFGSDVYPDVAVETKPKIDRKEAMRLARADCQETADDDRISDVQLCILPLRRPVDFDYLLCWKLYVFQPTVHKKWEYLVDAANGRILSKRNVLVYQNITGTAQGEYKPEFASDPTEVDTFPHEDISAWGLEAVIASWNFDSDPCWTTEGQWAFGTPTGGGGFLGSCIDPNSGYTGSNVYGYNLEGNYTNNMPACYLTTEPINCSGYENVYLKFMRWLGVEYGLFDNASIEVSNDGITWTTVWANGEEEFICDGAWVRVCYDISAVADMQPMVYIRWAMGPTDGSVTFAGWNIDDVEVVSIQGGISTTQTKADGSYSVVPPWNPSTITSVLEGLYCEIQYYCGDDAIFEQSEVHPNDVVDFTWDSNWYNEIVESSVYWNVNYVHDYYIAMDPSLSDSSIHFPSGLDYPMPVTVQLGCPYAYCNAYWDGEGLAFGAGDGLFCSDFGLYAEVVYHEYTHAVTSKIYDGVFFPYYMEPGAMNEAWSDYFGCVLSPSQSPLVGDGGLLPSYPDGLRTLDNTYRRETDFSNEVHFDSQMVSGALWEVRQLIDQQIDANVCDEIVHFGRYAHPQTFEEYLLAILVEDDTRHSDYYLGNGTPHAEAIYTGFGNHGIGGLQYLVPSIVIDESSGNANGELEPGETANLLLSLTNGWASATNISATLATTDPFVVITKAEAVFPDVSHGDITDNGADSFVVSLGAACPKTHTINFTLQITADGPYSYSRTCLFTYPVAVSQLAYDDGQVDDAFIGYGAPGGGLAVRVTPEIYPCYPTHVRFFPNAEEDGAITITLTVWDDDGPRGLPGTVLGSVQADVNGTGDWFDVDISSLELGIDSGSFYVGWIEGGTTYYNGMDMDPPYYQRSWVYFSWGEWVPFADVGFLANLMVRVRYFYTTVDGPVENLTTGKRYDYIQHAIYDAADGDEIVVSEGVYYENIDFRGKSLMLRSTDPNDPVVAASTVIDGGEQGPVVTFSSGEDRSCVLCGFTITGGAKSGGNEGGILCLGLDQARGPTISNCVVTENAGDGVYSNNSSPTIINCTVVENEDNGIELRYCSGPAIINCTVVGNRDNGIGLRDSSNPAIINCSVVENKDHGINLRDCNSPTVANSIIVGSEDHGIKLRDCSSTTITNSTIVGNEEDGISGGDPTITNCIVWDNLSSAISGHAVTTYSNIEGGWPGLGNIDTDPCFVDPNGGDYHLKSRGWRWDCDAEQWTWDDVTSRCIDAGNPGSSLGDEAVTLDVDPLNRFGRNLRINMGTYGGTGEASMPPHGWALLADLTNNGVVDFVDLAYWVENWLSGGSEWPGDLDRNGIVDMLDFALFAQYCFSETSWHEP